MVLRKEARNVLDRYASIVSNVKDKALVSCSNNGGYVIHTPVQVLFNLKFCDKREQAIHDLVVSHALKAEQESSGTFTRVIRRVLDEFVTSCDGNPHRDVSNCLGDTSEHQVVAASRDDLERVFEEHAANASFVARSMLREALLLAGFGGKIIVEKTHSVPSVELVTGYTFRATPCWPLNVKVDRPRVLCIDGFIESVSELHHVLEEASGSKTPVVLFVRGLADDVKHTLKVNYDRGTLVVFPVVVPFDVQGINTLNDVSIASGSRLVSSHTGELINNIRLSDVAQVEKAIIRPSNVVIVERSTKREVSSHVNHLQNKRLDEKIEDVARLYDDRIRSLSPNHVVIRLLDDKDYVMQSQAIDQTLRSIRSLLDHGVIVLDNDRRSAFKDNVVKRHVIECVSAIRDVRLL